MLVEGKELW
jgi:hypothetical protein